MTQTPRLENPLTATPQKLPKKSRIRVWWSKLELGKNERIRRREKDDANAYERAQKRISQFQAGTTLSGGEKDSILNRIKAVEELRAKEYIYRKSAFRITLKWLFVIALIGVGADTARILHQLSLQWPHSYGEIAGVFIGGLVCFFITLVPLWFWLNVTLKANIDNIIRVSYSIFDSFIDRLFVGWAILLVVYFAIIFFVLRLGHQVINVKNLLLYCPDSLPLASVIIGMQSFFVLCIFLVAGALVGLSIEKLLILAYHRHYPEVIIIGNLSRLLIEVEHAATPQTLNGSAWAQSKNKVRMMVLIEEVSRSMEKDFPKRLPAEDAFTNVWLKQEAKKAAEAVRDLKKWILLPKPDTKDNLAQRVGSTLLFAAQGNWDMLERKDIDEASQKKMWNVHLFMGLKAAIIGGLIFALTWSLHHLPMHILPEWSLYVGPIITLVCWLKQSDFFNGPGLEALKTIKEIATLGFDKK